MHIVRLLVCKRVSITPVLSPAMVSPAVAHIAGANDPTFDFGSLGMGKGSRKVLTNAWRRDTIIHVKRNCLYVQVSW